jgi:hypothetical protein
MTADEARIELAALLERNGNIRFPSDDRGSSKKGWEVRWVAKDWGEADHIRILLAAVGLSAASPYVKRTQIVQPVYGRNAVEMFLGTARVQGRESDRPAAVKRLVRSREKEWIASLPIEERRLVMMRRFYERFLADDAEDSPRQADHSRDGLRER